MRLIHGIILLLAISANCVVAQEAAPSENQAIPTESDIVTRTLAQVHVMGNDLFAVTELGSLTADKRAEIVEENIRAAIASSQDIDVEMDVRLEEFGLAIYADGVRVTLVTEADAALDGLDVEAMAKLQSDTLRNEISSIRNGHSDAQIDLGIRQLLTSTALFLLGGFIVLIVSRRISRWLEKLIETRLSNVERVTSDLVQSHAIATFAAQAVRLAAIALIITLAYYYLSSVLYAFEGTRKIALKLIELISDPVRSLLRSAIDSIPSMIALVLIYFVTRFVLKFLRQVFLSIDGGRLKIQGFERQWIWPTYNIVRAMLIILALVFAFPHIPGSESEAFKGVSIVLGVMMSLGSSSVVGNLLAGLFIIYKRSTNIGDRIRVGEHVGDVIAIKLTETHLKSVKNELISIPNAQLLNSEIINYSTEVDGRGLLVHTTVGIGYEEPQDKVEAMLIDAANRTSGLNQTPQPFVLRTALADYAVNYQINAFSSRGASMPKILSDLHSNILNIFNAAGVQIMTPSYVSDPEMPKIPPIEKVKDVKKPKAAAKPKTGKA